AAPHVAEVELEGRSPWRRRRADVAHHGASERTRSRVDQRSTQEAPGTVGSDHGARRDLAVRRSQPDAPPGALDRLDLHALPHLDAASPRCAEQHGVELAATDDPATAVAVDLDRLAANRHARAIDADGGNLELEVELAEQVEGARDEASGAGLVARENGP